MIEIGNKKIDMAEVHAFADDLQQISADVHAQLANVIKSIEAIDGMSSFSGKTAQDAKRYFNELHVTVLAAFQGLFAELEANVRQHIKTFESEVDDSENAIITSHHLEAVREDIEEVFGKLKNEDETIHDIISGVSDLTSAKSPDFLEVNEWRKKSVKETKELEEDISSFINTGNKTDAQAVMWQIETVMSQASRSTEETRFKDFKGASGIDALGKLATYNKNNEMHIILNIFSKMDESERVKAGILAAENPEMFLDYLNEHFSDLLHTFGKRNLNEGIIHSDLYIELLEKVSPVYNAYTKLVNILSENGPIAMILNPGNFLPRLLQDKEIKSADIDKIKETEAYQNLAVKNQMTADEEAQLKNYLQNIDPDDRNSPYAPENYVHPGYGPITFWDKREVIVSNKDVTPDGLTGPTTATLTFMYALTREDAVVFVDPNTELDEKVIAGLFLIPTPAKFGKPFLKHADDIGGAANVGRKRKIDGDSLGIKGTDNVLGDGTVWENIKITQPLYEGTKIPKSFELVADGKKFWVHPNGTKHMVEYITRDATTHGMSINSQTLLSSFQNSIKNAVKEGIKYDEIMNIGNWELIFSKPRGDDLLPVIKHAVYRP